MSVATAETPDFSGSSMQNAIQAYIDAGNDWEVPHIEIATWIVNNDLFDVPFESKLKQCDKMVADTLKNTYSTTPGGRRHRSFLAAKRPYIDPDTGKASQRWLWADAKTCSATHVHMSFAAMRNSIGKDCKSLAETVAVLNEINPNLKGNPIQLSWDFTAEVEGE